MSTGPLSQADRDALEDVGLQTNSGHSDDEQILLSHSELEAT
jgi:hypothetical protein